MLYAVSRPRTYLVSASLLVNEARAEIPLAPSASQQLIINRVSEEELNSEIEILRSRQLIEDVVETIGIDRSGAGAEEPTSWIARGLGWLRSLQGGPQLSKFDGLVVHIQSSIEIFAVRKSNLITISFTAQDPEWATKVVKTLTDRYLERRAERFQSPQAVSFFENQMLQAQTKLVESEQVLRQLTDDASITIVGGGSGSDSLAAQKQLVMQRLAELESSLSSAEVELEFQSRTVASLREMLQREPERLESPNRENQDVASEEIERALATLRLQRDALLQDFRPDSRHVRDIDTQIKMAEARLEESRQASKFTGTEANPLYLEVKSELLRAQTSLEGAHARVASLRAQVLTYRREMDTLNSKAFEVESLYRDARAAEEDYLLYRKKFEEARISAAMDQEKFINVTVAQPAQMPRAPEPRGLILKLLVSVFVGLIGGVSLAFGMETFLDRSFTTGEDIERRLGIPHLASIPDSARLGQ